MSNISIIEVQTISPEELNMYLAEDINSFQLKDRRLGTLWLNMPGYRERKFRWFLSFMIDL